MTLGICSPCLLAMSIPSSLVLIERGTELLSIAERGPAFAELFRKIRAGEHSDYEPDSMFVINQERTGVDAVTMHHGTSVCATHLWHIEQMWQDWSVAVARRRW